MDFTARSKRKCGEWGTGALMKINWCKLLGHKYKVYGFTVSGKKHTTIGEYKTCKRCSDMVELWDEQKYNWEK
jgi:hypothetical protein